MGGGGGRGGRTISQEAFEGMVRENMEDLGMDPDEALEDAVQALTLQGVDLSGIVKCIPGITSSNDNPVRQALDELRKIAAAGSPPPGEMVTLLNRVHDLCSTAAGGGSENASIAVRNGAVELLCTVCSALDVGYEGAVVSALKVLGAVLHDLQSTEAFRHSDGPKIVVDIINKSNQSINILGSAFEVVSAAATGNEILKESFMDLRIDEIFVNTMRGQSKCCIESLYDAICVLLTADDNRVLASQVYGYARRFAQVGIMDALVEALQDGLSSLSSSSLVSVCIALKAVAVNDEICRSIFENGGIDATLQSIDGCGEQNKKAAARACCSLLAKLAGSDSNKIAIVQKGGLDRLIELSHRFSDDPSVLQEIMPVICSLSLRSPDNAARAVEAGAGDMARQAMQRFPAAYQMQKQCCLMIRNLVVRNPENRTILLNNGIEKLIRKAKGSHESCKDAATDALRDLGLDDYNS